MGVLSKAASYQMIIVKKGQISNLLGTMYIMFAEHRQKLDHIYTTICGFLSYFYRNFYRLTKPGVTDVMYQFPHVPFLDVMYHICKGYSLLITVQLYAKNVSKR